MGPHSSESPIRIPRSRSPRTTTPLGGQFRNARRGSRTREAGDAARDGARKQSRAPLFRLESRMPNLVLAIALLQSPQSVYHISAAVDIPVTLGAALAGAVPYLYTDKLIKPRCPCDPAEVNGFDRGASGNTNPTAARLSDVTVSTVRAAPHARAA